MTEIPYQEWVDALRSGDYNQTKETLKGELPDGGVGYCCLGVLADIMGYEIEVATYVGDEKDILYETEGPINIYTKFKEEIGVKFIDHLIKCNDEGMSFDDISNLIEKKKKKTMMTSSLK